MIFKRLPQKNESFHVGHLDRLSNLDGVPLAGFKRRSVAFLIDMIILIMLNGAFNLDDIITFSQTGTIEEKLSIMEKVKEELVGLAAMIFYFGLITYYYHGQTIGKRIMKIRVISLKHGKLTLWQSIERSLGYGASALEAGFGFFQIIWDENRQAVHDRIAETAVVKLKRNPKWRGSSAYYYRGSRMDDASLLNSVDSEEFLTSATLAQEISLPVENIMQKAPLLSEEATEDTLSTPGV